MIAGGAIWIYFLQSSLTELDQLARPIEKKINLTSPTERKPEESFLRDDGSLNWSVFENLAARHTLRSSHAESLVEGLVIDQQLVDLDPDHLKQTLTELETRTLSKGLKLRIEHTAAWLLARKNPLEILNSKKHHQWENPTSLSLKAFDLYAMTEPIAAAAWLDTQIKAGSLKSRSLLGKSDTRLRLELQLLPHLAKENYAMARIRVFDLSEPEREQLFSKPMYYRTEYPELLLLARESLPNQSANRIIANAYTPIYIGHDYLARTDKVLRSLPFSEEEKITILHDSVGKIISSDSQLEDILSAYRFVSEFSEPEASRLVAGKLARLAPKDLLKFYELTQSLASETKNEDLIPFFIRQLPLSSENFFKRLNGIQDLSISEKLRADYNRFLPENESE